MQRARDDRSLLHDSLERLVHDLRAQSHSAAFLARVNKRDAPDYYDVIKNPMDLGLMLKNVKSGKYRNKEAFRKDLDLIWDNCLAYNTEPVSVQPSYRPVAYRLTADELFSSHSEQSHPLRQSAELMRKRSHDLLSYIQDSNDVKSTLSEWLASHTSLSAAETKKLQSKEAASLLASGHLPSFGIPSDSIELYPSTAPPSDPITTAATLPLGSPPLTQDTTQLESKFENDRAIAIASGAEMADSTVRDRRQCERDEWALATYLEDPKRLQASSRPLFEAPDEETAVKDLVTGLSHGHPQGISAPSLASLTGPSKPYMNGTGAGPSSLSSSSSSSILAAKSSAERIACVLPKLPHNTSPEVNLSGVASSPRHRLRKRPIDSHQPNGLEAANAEGSRPKRRKAVEQIKRNMSTMKRMRRLKHKFDLLDYCLEKDEPMPSGLLLDSEDEDEDEPKRRAANGSGSADMGEEAQRRPYHGNGEPPPMEEWSADARRVSPLSSSEARSALQGRLSLIMGNTGFSAAQGRPVQVLTAIAENFISSLGRTMRMYSDRYGTTMSSEEIILHTLYATSSMGVKDLDKYMNEDIPRAQSRLDELKRKLEASWEERVAFGEQRLVSEEDARYFGEESEDLMAGNLPSALDDDFFGFKALGLDAELGMTNLSVPSRLMRPRIQRPKTALAKVKEEQEEAFTPPKAFVRITEAAVPAQIGLLQSFYRELLHRRGYRVGSRPSQGQGAQEPKEGHEAEDGGSPPQENAADEDEGEVEGMLIVGEEEEEQRLPKYKIPLTGKLPVRQFWSANPPPTASSSTAAGAGAAAASSAKNAPATNAKGAKATGKGGGGAGRKGGAANSASVAASKKKATGKKG